MGYKIVGRINVTEHGGIHIHVEDRDYFARFEELRNVLEGKLSYCNVNVIIDSNNNKIVYSPNSSKRRHL